MNHTSRIVLGIVASPRQSGNTELLVNEVLRGARDAGASTSRIRLSDLRIQPCTACEECVRTGTCAQQDDMRSVAEQMKLSSVWGLGTPVYLFGPPAQFKAFLGRWIGVPEANFVGKKAALVVPFAAPMPGVAEHTLGTLRSALQYRKMEHAASIVGPGLLDVGAVSDHPNLLASAYEVGRQAVSSQKSG